MSTASVDIIGYMINRKTKYDDLPEYLTPGDFCSYLGLGRTTIYALIERGEVPCKKFGRRIFIPKEALRSQDQT